MANPLDADAPSPGPDNGPGLSRRQLLAGLALYGPAIWSLLRNSEPKLEPGKQRPLINTEPTAENLMPRLGGAINPALLVTRSVKNRIEAWQNPTVDIEHEFATGGSLRLIGPEIKEAAWAKDKDRIHQAIADANIIFVPRMVASKEDAAAEEGAYISRIGQAAYDAKKKLYTTEKFDPILNMNAGVSGIVSLALSGKMLVFEMRDPLHVAVSMIAAPLYGALGSADGAKFPRSFDISYPDSVIIKILAQLRSAAQQKGERVLCVIDPVRAREIAAYLDNRSLVAWKEVVYSRTYWKLENPAPDNGADEADEVE